MIRSALLLLVSVTLCSAACDAGWKEFQGSCYKEFEESSLIGWWFASGQCMWDYGYLVSIQSEDEFKFVKDNVMASQPNTDSEAKYAPWVGLRYDPKTNKSYGSTNPYEHWLPSQPSSSNGVDDDCGRFVVGSTAANTGYTLNSCTQAASFRYICEMTMPTTTAPTTTTPACPSNTAHLYTVVGNGLNRIWRTYNAPLKYHQYNTNYNAARANGQSWEGNVGYYMNSTIYQRVKTCCPKLIEMKLMQNKAQPHISHITPWLQWTHPNWYQKANKFYCAPSKNYCGANFQLIEIHKVVGSGEHLDAFIPKSNYERSVVLTNKFPKYRNQVARSICWVWQWAGIF